MKSETLKKRVPLWEFAFFIKSLHIFVSAVSSFCLDSSSFVLFAFNTVESNR